MPSRQRVYLPTFDLAATYLAARSFTFGGKTFTADEPFDKSLVGTRKLRQLYDARKIKTVAGTGREAAPKRSHLAALNAQDPVKLAYAGRIADRKKAEAAKLSPLGEEQDLSTSAYGAEISGAELERQYGGGQPSPAGDPEPEVVTPITEPTEEPVQKPEPDSEAGVVQMNDARPEVTKSQARVGQESHRNPQKRRAARATRKKKGGKRK